MAGEGIEAGWGIEAGRGIVAGDDVTAGDDFAIYVGVGLRISRREKYAVVISKNKPANQIIGGTWGRRIFSGKPNRRLGKEGTKVVGGKLN